MRNGMGMGAGGGKAGIDPAVKAYFTAMGDSYASLSAAQKMQYANRILALKANAALWAAIDQILFLDAIDMNTAMLNAKAPGTMNASNSNGNHAPYIGWTGSATVGDNKFIDSNVNVSNLSPNRLDNLAIFVMVKTYVAGTAYLAGAASGTNNAITFLSIATGATAPFRSAINSAAGGFMDSATQTPSTGLFVSVRQTNNEIRMYRNASSPIATGTTTSVGIPNVNLYYAAQNNNGTIAAPSASTFQIAGVSKKLTGNQVAELATIIAANPFTA